MSKEKILSPLGYNKNRERVQNDFYSTEPQAIDYLLQCETFNTNIWECAVGNGNLANRLVEHGYNVVGSDIIDRGYQNTLILDFMTVKNKPSSIGGPVDIITNPPYKYVTEFVNQAYRLADRKVAMFLKIQFLETKKRYEQIFDSIPPKSVNIFVKRIPCYRNDVRDDKGSAVCYAWFIWDKQYHDDTVVNWIKNY